MTGSLEGDAESVPAATRWFVRSFLAAFVVCAIFGIEQLWPLTGFRLFSRVRTESRAMWVADTVTADGREAPLWFTHLPRAYQGFGLIMGGFWRLSSRAKRATCAAWLSEARHVRPPATAIRIYRLAWRALPRHGQHPPPASRTLAYACP